MTAQATRQLTTRKTWSASWSPDKMRATSTVWLPPTNPKFYSTTGKDVVRGREPIRRFFAELVAQGRKFKMGKQRPAMVCGDLALTSTSVPDCTMTAKVARRVSRVSQGSGDFRVSSPCSPTRWGGER